MGPLPLIPSRAKRDRCVWQTQRPLLRFAEIGDQPFERPASRATTLAPSGRCCCATDHRCCRIAPFCDGQHTCKIRFPQFNAAEMKLAFCEVVRVFGEATVVGAEVLAQSEKYQQYAEEAQEQAERASTDADRAAWLLIARSWLNLRPLVDDPAELTHPRASVERPLAGRLHRLRRLRASPPP